MSQFMYATFGGGCFWCIETVFAELNGVVNVVPGYAGGHTKNPTYEQVCTGTTNHAEVVNICFNPDIITYQELLEVFFSVHDPTTLDRQGSDVGTQYRSVIFYRDLRQKELAEAAIAVQQKFWPDPIVTEVIPFTVFYQAEDYHHNYYQQHSEQAYCSLVIKPKVGNFRKRFSEKIKLKE